MCKPRAVRTLDLPSLIQKRKNIEFVDESTQKSSESVRNSALVTSSLHGIVFECPEVKTAREISPPRSKPQFRKVKKCRVRKTCGSKQYLGDLVPSIYGGVVKGVEFFMDIPDIPAILWKTPKHFSQSWLCGRKKPSSACTIISLILAEHIYRQEVVLPTLDKNSRMISIDIHDEVEDETFECPKRLLNALSNAIIDGNGIYEQTHQTHSSNKRTFTVPEAIKATNDVLEEVEYSSGIGPFHQNIVFYLSTALNSPLTKDFDRIFFLLLIFERSVLLVYQRFNNTIAIIDSHTHFERGALIACTHIDQLVDFGVLLSRTFFPESCILEPELHSFELSLVRFHGPLTNNDCATRIQPSPAVDKNNAIFPPPIRTKRIKTRVRPYQVVREHLNVHYRMIREIVSPTLVVPEFIPTDV